MITLSNSMTALLEHNEASYILPQKLIPEITFDSTWGDLIARVKNHPNLIFKVKVEMKKRNDYMYQTFKQ